MGLGLGLEGALDRGVPVGGGDGGFVREALLVRVRVRVRVRTRVRVRVRVRFRGRVRVRVRVRCSCSPGVARRGARRRRSSGSA